MDRVVIQAQRRSYALSHFRRELKRERSGLVTTLFAFSHSEKETTMKGIEVTIGNGDWDPYQISKTSSLLETAIFNETTKDSESHKPQLGSR